MTVDTLGIQVVRAVGSTPWTIVALVGLILCMLNYSRAPRISVLVGIAILLQLFNAFVMPFVSSFLFSLAPAQQMDNIRIRILIDSVMYSIPAGIALAILLWAIFSQVGELHRRRMEDG